MVLKAIWKESVQRRWVSLWTDVCSTPRPSRRFRSGHPASILQVSCKAYVYYCSYQFYHKTDNSITEWEKSVKPVTHRMTRWPTLSADVHCRATFLTSDIDDRQCWPVHVSRNSDIVGRQYRSTTVVKYDIRHGPTVSAVNVKLTHLNGVYVPASQADNVWITILCITSWKWRYFKLCNNVLIWLQSNNIIS